MRYDLSNLGPGRFEQLARALFAQVYGPQTQISGPGPDAGRDALIPGDVTLASGQIFRGPIILQSKYKDKLSDRSDNNGRWLYAQIKQELEEFRTNPRRTQRPRTYVVASNVELTLTPQGSRDQINALFAAYRQQFADGSFAQIVLWGGEEIRQKLDLHLDVARSYCDAVAPGPVLAGLHDVVTGVNQLIVRQRRAEGKTQALEWFTHWPDGPEPPHPNPPPNNGFKAAVYVDRAIESDLKAILATGAAAGVVGLRGMGGVGKTYLAQKIAQDHHRAGGLVAWLGLLDLSLTEAYDDLANAFNLRFVAPLEDAQKSAALAYLLHRHRKATPQLLIVLDNAERFAGLGELLRLCQGLPVLVTSRTEEEAEQIAYRRLEAMDPAQSLTLCRNLLNQRRAGLFDSLSAAEIEALTGLCADLGGHPLGIRLALAGVISELTKPKALRGACLAEHRQTLRAQPIALLHSADAADARLQRSVQQSFDWLFHDLPSRAPKIGRAAQLLLPLIAAMAAAPIPFPALRAGVKSLIALIDAARRSQRDPAPDWIDALGQMVERDALLAALTLLDEIALLTLTDADEDPAQELWIALHPLVREYAFHERAQAGAALDAAGRLTASGPSGDALALAAVEGSTGMAGRAELFLDLLQRRPTAAVLRKICDLTPELAAHYCWVVRNWGVAERLLSRAAERTEALDDAALRGALLSALGELQLRRNDPTGRTRVEQAADLLATDPSPDAQRRAAWTRHLLLYYSDAPSTLEAVRARFAFLRRSLGAPATEHSHALCSALQMEVASHRDESAPDLYAYDLFLRSSFNTNLVFCLFHFLNAFHPLTPADLQRLDSLFDQAQRRHQGRTNAVDVISPEHDLEYRAGRILRALEQGRLDAPTLTQQFDALAQQARGYGLRGFDLEALRQKGLWALAMQAGEWPQAVDHAVRMAQAAQADAPLAPYRAPAFARTLGLLSQILAAAPEALPALAAALEQQQADAQRHFANDLVGWRCLCAAALAWRRGAQAAEIVARMLQARRAFLRQGGVPHSAEQLFKRLRDAIDADGPVFEATRDRIPPAAATPPDAQPWNLARRRPLPPRVRCRRDGRAMRLVEGGWTPGPWSGPTARDIYLHPFYIDDAPLTGADLRRIGLHALAPSDPAEEDEWIRLTRAELRQLCEQCGKTAPIAAEWSAMVWRLQAGGVLLDGADWTGMKEAIFDRLERAIAGDVSPQLLWPDPVASGPVLRRPLSHEGEAARKDLFDYWWTDAWILDHPAALTLLQDHLLPRLRAGIFYHLSESEAYEFALGMINSVSLFQADHERVLNALPTLTQDQINALRKGFSEEREDYLKLVEDECAAIASYIHRRVCNALRPLPTSAPPTTRQLAMRLGKGAFGVWIDSMGDDATPWRVALNAAHDAADSQKLTPLMPPEYLDQLDIDGVGPYPDERHFVRLVRPLFTTHDLEDLDPIDEDAPLSV